MSTCRECNMLFCPLPPAPCPLQSRTLCETQPYLFLVAKITMETQKLTVRLPVDNIAIPQGIRTKSRHHGYRSAASLPLPWVKRLEDDLRERLGNVPDMFRRLLDRWFAKEPGTPERELVQRAMDGTYGVDINPYAVAIARFRLLVEALKASRIHRLKEAPGYRINVTAGDSLLHGPRLLTAADSLARHEARSGELDLGSGAEQLRSQPGIEHAFDAEELDELNRILGQSYHAVVGNPPYITVKDKALNQLYRDRYATCHRQYALAVPFTERFFQLAVSGAEVPSPQPLSRGERGFAGVSSPQPFSRGKGGFAGDRFG
jgi:hypothetical protein